MFTFIHKHIDQFDIVSTITFITTLVAYSSRKNICILAIYKYKHTYIQCVEMQSNTRGLNVTYQELNNTDLTTTRKKDSVIARLVHM